MSAVQRARRLVRRLVRRLGRFFLLALAVGALGVVLALLGVVLSSLPLGALGVSVSLLGVLAAIVGQQTRSRPDARVPASDPARRKPPAVTGRASAAAPDGISLTDLIRIQEATQGTIVAQHELLARDLQQRLDLIRRDSQVQQGALAQLYASHRPPAVLPMDGAGPSPVQLLELLELVTGRSPLRVLAVDTGSASVWLAAALATSGGTLDVVESDATTLERLRTLLPVEGTGRVLPGTARVPSVAHAYLPWHDLAAAGDGYDLVVVHAGGHRARAALPVLPLLGSRLGAAGAVVLLDDGQVGQAWARTPGWISQPEPAGLLVLRPDPGGSSAASQQPVGAADEVSPPSFPGRVDRTRVVEQHVELGAPRRPAADLVLSGPASSAPPSFSFLGSLPRTTEATLSASGWPRLHRPWPTLPPDQLAGSTLRVQPGSRAEVGTRAGEQLSAGDATLVLLVGSSAGNRIGACLQAVASDARLRQMRVVVIHAEDDLHPPEGIGADVRWVRVADSSRATLAQGFAQRLLRIDTPYLVVSTLPRAREIAQLGSQVARAAQGLTGIGPVPGVPILLPTTTTPREVVARYVSHVLNHHLDDVAELADHLGAALLDASRPVLDSIDPRDGEIDLRVFVQTQLEPDVPAPPWRFRVVLEQGDRVVARSAPTPLVPSVNRYGTARFDDLLARVPLVAAGTGQYRVSLELATQDPALRHRRTIRPRLGALLAARSVTMPTREGARVRYLLLQGMTVPDTCYLSVAVGPAAEVDRAWRRSLLGKDLALIVRHRDQGRLRWWRLVRLLTRPLYARQRIWLVGERSDTAQDNGLHLYTHLRQTHPERRVHYLIDADSPQRSRVEGLGGVVRHSSLRHRLLMLHAEVLAGTNSIHYMLPAGWDPAEYARHLAWRVGALRVYLKHGVHLSPNAVKRGAQGYDLVLTVTPRETAALRRVSGYDEQLVETGLPRYDALTPTPASRTILFMSTWRRYLVPRLFSGGEADRSLFDDSDYQRFMYSLLGSERLQAMLVEHDFRLLFVPHYQLARYFTGVSTGGDRISIGDVDESDLQGMLRQCDVFLTDHSSVHFDVAYLDTPIVYARFDREEFESRHASADWFDYERDGFGPVTYTLDQTLDALEEVLDRDCTQVRRYRARIEAEFTHRDQDNCGRTVTAIDDRLARLHR